MLQHDDIRVHVATINIIFCIESLHNKNKKGLNPLSAKETLITNKMGQNLPEEGPLERSYSQPYI